MRAVADRLAAFLGGLTTVPETAPSGKPVAPAGKPKTTFGDSAAELMADGEASARPARRAPLLLGVGAAIAVVAIGAVVLRRKPAASATPAVVPAGIATTVASPAAAVVPGASAAAPVKIDPRAWTTWQKDPPRAKHPAVRRVAEAEPPSGPERHSNPSAARSGEAPAAADGEAPPVDFTGIWEGPWTDAARHQNGRLYLQIAGNGAVSGWFSNAAVRQSFRLTGRMASPGDLALACACPPRQEFGARVLVHAAGGELKGQLTLSGDSGVFGQSHLTLRRAAAR